MVMALTFPQMEDSLAYEAWTDFRCNSEEPIYEKLRAGGNGRGDDEGGARGDAKSRGSIILTADTGWEWLGLLLCLLCLLLALCGIASGIYLATRDRETLLLFSKGFQQLDDGCWYYFGANATNADHAQRRCRELGGRLAEVRSQKDHIVLTAHLSSLRRAHWWLGASDRREEGHFQWLSDGLPVQEVWSGRSEPMQKKLWAKGQPDNWPAQRGQPEEDCLIYMFNLDSENEWKWNDYDCERTANYICRRP